MSNVLDLINEIPVEDLFKIRMSIVELMEEKIRKATNEVKFQKVGNNNWLTYNEITIICVPVSSGHDIYNTVIGKSGKLIKGELILKRESSPIRQIAMRLRCGKILGATAVK